MCSYIKYFMDITKITNFNIQGSTIKKDQPRLGSDKFTIGHNPQAALLSGIVLTPIDALFLNLDARRKNNKKAVEKSNQIVNQLENLRIEIISGNINKQTLSNIAQLLHKQDITEEPLRSIILEVETRAKVELAKLESAP